jgi:hypothetical protein
MKEENIPSDVFDLIAQKPYEQLSEEEQLKITPWMTPEEYTDYHQVVGLIQESENQSDYSLQEQSWPDRQVTGFKRLAMRPVPAYQVAALALLVFALSFLFQPASNKATEVKPLVTNTEGTPISQDSYPEDLVFNP